MAELPWELDPRRLTRLSPGEQRKILNLPQAIDHIAASIMDFYIKSHPEFLPALKDAGFDPKKFEDDIRESVAEAIRKSGIQ